MLLQLGDSMQRIFGTTVAAALGPHVRLPPPTSQCGELASCLRIIAKRDEERVAAEKRAAEKRAAEKRVYPVHSPRSSLATPIKSLVGQGASAFKPPDKASRRSSKQVEVVVEVASDDEEHIDGVTDWIGALLHARHLLPGAAQPKPPAAAAGHVTSEQNVDVAESPLAPAAVGLCPLDVALTIDDLRREVAAFRVMVEQGDAETAVLQASVRALPAKASANAATLKAKLDASLSSHADNVKTLADLESQIAAHSKCIDESLAHVPVDTRSQFLVEVRCAYASFLGAGASLSRRRAVCASETFGNYAVAMFNCRPRVLLVLLVSWLRPVSLWRRQLRGVLRPQKRRHKHRLEAPPPETESSDICFLCLADYHDELILLCDGEGCSNAAHMFCLTPPLLSVRSVCSRAS